MKLFSLAFLTFVLVPSAQASESELKVLSYNVQGLPWPAKKPKGELSRIGEIFGEMRAKGTQPQIVFLQEAFRPQKISKLIQNSGYPYSVKGPDNEGRILDSGIYVLSDFKILSVKKLAFGTACAGLDCASNKAVMMVELEVPGWSQPLVVFNTHMNSGKSSLVKPAKYIASRHMQIAKIGTLMEQANLEGKTVIFGGDFNTAPLKDPWDALTDTLGMSNAEEYCMDHPENCTRLSEEDDEDFFLRSADHIFYQSSDAVTLTPLSVEKTFKILHGDRYISDHFGHEVVFRVQTK
jgi:endonuclease/exonuclease/phosphatase family metal-dependent hydrolase